MSNKYVKVDDIMSLINTKNRGNFDYFIVDKIEELCNSNKTYNMDIVVDKLIKEMKMYQNDISVVDDTHKIIENFAIVKGIMKAIKIVINEGVKNE